MDGPAIMVENLGAGTSLEAWTPWEDSDFWFQPIWRSMRDTKAKRPQKIRKFLELAPPPPPPASPPSLGGAMAEGQENKIREPKEGGEGCQGGQIKGPSKNFSALVFFFWLFPLHLCFRCLLTESCHSCRIINLCC